MNIRAINAMNTNLTSKKILFLIVSFLCSFLSFSQQDSFGEMLNVTYSIENGRDISDNNASAMNSVKNEITLISVDEKTVFVLISTNGIVDQSNYSKAEDVNDYFMKTEGIIKCSYSWNNNNMKLVLNKTNAKEILINTFGFESNIISNLF
jgi:hypothetical protein